jgi:hypothetical protein
MTYYELGYERRDRLFSDYRTLYKQYYGVSMSDLKMRRLLINNITDRDLKIRIEALRMLLELND